METLTDPATTGGGVVYSSANKVLAEFAEKTGIPVGSTQAGKGALPHDHPMNSGPMGALGLRFANRLAHTADLVIGVGTRYTDFTSAFNTMFQNPQVHVVNINVLSFDAHKEAAIPVIGDARETLSELQEVLGDWQVDEDYRREAMAQADEQRQAVDCMVQHIPGTEGLGQKEVIGIVNEFARPQDVVVNAAGSMPSDLQKLWKAGSPLGYSVEYGYSCMGYEIPAALGMRIADPSREIFSFFGDASFIMYHQDVLTAIQEREKIILLLLDNGGYGSIHSLSMQVGSQGFETKYYYRGGNGRQNLKEPLQVDFPKILEGYGVKTYTVEDADQLRQALHKAVASNQITAI
ncbi:thiamine pyrophosphate-dependent enzyme [Bifidobacterium asteroides]|uniref:thiamine pyrophosphate-dependent enzyme n=1 Tax=Bifidobacterium asteroides TaxID=1684 RepID=UPI0015D5D24D|nr:thiamine pyrophosphate-dependent enzyme [Bifidobacterium asteroides]